MTGGPRVLDLAATHGTVFRASSLTLEQRYKTHVRTRSKMKCRKGEIIAISEAPVSG